MTVKKVAIVGSGISGLCCAYFLAKNPRLKISIYSDPDLMSASKAAIGLISTKGQLVNQDPLVSLKNAAGYYFPKFLQLVNNDLQILNMKPADYFMGAYEPYKNLTELSRINQRVFQNTFRGLNLVKHLSAKEFLVHSSLKHERLEAFYFPKDIVIDPLHLMGKLRELLSQNSQVEFVDNHALSCEYAVENKWKIILEKPKIPNKDDNYQYVISACGEGAIKFLDGYLDRNNELFAVPGWSIRVPSSHDDIGLHHKGYSCSVVANEATFSGGNELIEAGDINTVEPAMYFSKLLNLNTKKFKIQSGTRIRTKCRTPFISSLEGDFPKNSLIVVSGMYKNGFSFAPYLASKYFSDNQWLAKPFD